MGILHYYIYILKNQDGGDHVVVRSEDTKESFLEMYTFTYIVSYGGERRSLGGTRRLGDLRIMM